ncbi:MAG: trypsin-like peptidase domain-containing protein [Syntrophaceticus sp.]|nr:trypsin-like peptidase domain-containing protein [Syntrophaceticus sp.]MDD4359805.1 trypsin-like peptidase domain-containing protein [Syntrophaceticus sp.]MDD4782443.1 trypsin-like peptidase domain-containing protein [Syntrophaceticus sp.]
MKAKKVVIAVILGAFLAGIAFTGGILFASSNNWIGQVLGNQNAESESTPESDSGDRPGAEEDTIAEIIEKAGPAVVKIETYTTTSESANPMFNDPFFREFFGQSAPQEQRVQQGLGSGLIISADGYILTNEHVISGAQKIQVNLAGEDDPLPAEVIGSDHDLDLAVLKVDAGSDLPVLKLGSSSDVAVGNWVIAIGNPYGLDHTVTVGVISAKGRPVTVDDRNFRDLLQTDASINPGNSGGPLLNLQGEVIGINTAVSSQAQGIGFAIPSDTVNGVLDDLVQDGKISRGWLGVQIQDVTDSIAETYGLSEPEGVLVSDVLDGPAADAGLIKGDIITAVDGKKVSTADELLTTIQKTEPGENVKLDIWRNEKAEEYTVKLTERL